MTSERDNSFQGKERRRAKRVKGTIIEYALDGEGLNSPYTGSLLKHIGTPALSAEQVMKRTIADVMRKTDGRQIPWYGSSIGGDIVPFPDQN